MENIDITDKLVEFYNHLTEPDVDRTIFSAKFGDGKTVFLRQFVEKYKYDFDFYTLYPVNYQIAPNDKVMEYIKRDILFQLILKSKITPDIEIPDSILLQWYINNKFDSILQDVISFAPSFVGNNKMLGTVLSVSLGLLKKVKEYGKKFEVFKRQINEISDFTQASKAIEEMSNGEGNIYELDPITYLIAKAISSSDKPSALIIEDLDRIDPAHLFRILNVFSAHIDRKYLASSYTINKDGKEQYLDELPNKFGFAKVVFVMDADGTEAIFKHFYGESNYKGYISKFLSKRIFRYSINDFAISQLENHLKRNCQFDYSTLIKGQKSLGIDLNKISVRDIAKVLDNFDDAYKVKEIKVNDTFIFMSDTPLVKLLATLLRLGVRKENLLDFFLDIKPSSSLLEILGCYAMTEETLVQSDMVFYEGSVYQFYFEERNGLKELLKVDEPYTQNGLVNQFSFLQLNVHEVIERALRYVN